MEKTMGWTAASFHYFTIKVMMMTVVMMMVMRMRTWTMVMMLRTMMMVVLMRIEPSCSICKYRYKPEEVRNGSRCVFGLAGPLGCSVAVGLACRIVARWADDNWNIC